MEEVWKEIKGYEGLYEISNLGRVRSLDKVTITTNGRRFPFKGRILKNKKRADGYLEIGLTKDKKRKSYRVHRLVAETFIPNPDNKKYVDHINTIKDDNRVENLRWVTASENQYNELTMIRKKEYKGEKCYWYGVTGKDNPLSIKVVQLSMDGELIKIWDGINETRKFGYNHVWECCNGRRVKHKGYRWMYYEDYIKLNDK